MASVSDADLPKLVAFPEFFDRLRDSGALDVRGAIQSETEIDGIVYHHRGVQVPAHEAAFVWEPGAAGDDGVDNGDSVDHGERDGSGPGHVEGEGGADETDRGPTFSFEVSAVGPRHAYAVFDATRSWDVYLLLFEGGAVVAWMSDEEFAVEESEEFPTKAAAVEAGRFSFGAFFRFGPDWVEREEWALSSTAPALIQLGDGRLLQPADEDEFLQHTQAIPVELQPGNAPAPAHLGVVAAAVSVDR